MAALWLRVLQVAAVCVVCVVCGVCVATNGGAAPPYSPARHHQPGGVGGAVPGLRSAATMLNPVPGAVASAFIPTFIPSEAQLQGRERRQRFPVVAEEGTRERVCPRLPSPARVSKCHQTHTEVVCSSALPATSPARPAQVYTGKLEVTVQKVVNELPRAYSDVYLVASRRRRAHGSEQTAPIGRGSSGNRR